MQAALFESVTRRQFWIGTLTLTAGLIVASWFAGFYGVTDTTPGGPGEDQARAEDPLAAFLFSPLGNVVILLVLQFLTAVVLFWIVIAAWSRARRRPADLSK